MNRTRRTAPMRPDRRPLREPRWRAAHIALAAAALLPLMAPTPCRAGLVLGFQASSAAPGQGGDLYLTLTNQDDGSGTVYDINSFDVEPTLVGTGITFTAADRDMGASG